MMFTKILGRIDDKGLRVQISYLLYQKRLHWVLADIEGFDITETSSGTVGGEKTSYYAVCLTPGDDQRINGDLLDREAQWLADHCNAALGRLK